MKKNRNRWISLLLALAMALSLCAGSLAAELEAALPIGDESALAETDGEESAPEEPLKEEEPQKEAEASCSEESAPEESAAEPEEADPAESVPEEAAPEESAAGSEEADTEEAAPEEDPEPVRIQAEQENADLNVIETIPLSLRYDDRFTFSEVKSGYVVAQIRKQEVTSFQVSEGEVTKTKDGAVITLNSGSHTDAVATGTGTATVMLVKKGDLAAAEKLLEKGGTQSVDAVQVDVEVAPAPLTLMFLAGQSNMEGWGSDPGHGAAKTFQHPEHSIVCPEGVVYSTYAPGNTAIKTRANSIGGNVNFGGTYCKRSNAKNYIPKSLTGGGYSWSLKGGKCTWSLGGTQLVYPINQLTAAGSGKSGPDSGLAWEWNRLTGDKVWTVNAAVGSSSINLWVPGKFCYERAEVLFGKAKDLWEAEVQAGHYTKGSRLYFWLQGEKDYQLSGSKYWNQFQLMHKYMKKLLDVDQFGIISVRGSGSGMKRKAYTTSKDLVMIGPRVVQRYLANSTKLEDVHMVSDVNEQWVSDSGVARYFRSAYNGSLDYPIHSGSLALPTKVSQVHNDIHYMQVGHNENGITAARGMYQVCTGTAEAKKIRWLDHSGKAITSLNLAKGQSAFVVPAVDNAAASKTVKWRFSKGLSYSGTSGKVSVTGSGAQQIEAVTADGTVLSRLVVSTGKTLSAPGLNSVSNVKGKKIKAAWDKVSGAKGYQIQCSLKSGFSGSVKTLSATGTSATMKGFKAKKTYYVRVRAWMKNSGGTVYSSWSNTKSVKVTK